MTNGRLIFSGRPDAHPAAHRFSTETPATPVVPWTTELWLPEPFEPRYAYPLLVLLHDAGDNELTETVVANAAASQNMIVLSVRGFSTSGEGYSWSDDSQDTDGSRVWGRVAEELAELPPELRYHEERVFITGRGAGAIAAWRAWINHGDQIAGAALIDPPTNSDDSPLRTVAHAATSKPALNGRLWIGGESVQPWRTTARSAYALGAEVSLDPTAKTSEEVGKSLDRWVMRALPTAVFA